MTDELIRRIDALVRREGSSAADGEVPVLTDVVAEESLLPRPVDDAALEALARALERTVLERLGPEVDRIIEERARALNTALGEAVVEVRAEIALSVQQTVREAVAASVAFALRPKTPE
ncbi:MAG TPA: hypothetical protein VJ778_12385 [Burkholderiales bacterium]|nr:hypothetical protein [Burkholderiales bacterium]